MALKNKTYDVMKWIAQYLLPALGTLYFALAKIWSLPYGEEIVGTISAIDIFLGVILGISKANYNGDGQIVINDSDPDKDVFSLELNDDIASLPDKTFVTFKVAKEEEK